MRIATQNEKEKEKKTHRRYVSTDQSDCEAMQGLTKVDTISDCKVCTYSLSLLSLYLIIYLPYKRAFCSIN